MSSPQQFLFHARRILALADMEASGIDFQGNLLSLYAAAGARQKVGYGSFTFNLLRYLFFCKFF